MHAGGPLSGRYTRIQMQFGTDRKDGRSSSPAGRLPACAQHKYPAQIEDIEKAYRWLFEQGIRPPKNIASIGHSFGGNLAVNRAITIGAKGAARQAPFCRSRHGMTWRRTTRRWITMQRPTNSSRRHCYDCFRTSCSHFTSLTVQLDETQLLQAEWRSYSVSATS